MQAQKAEGTRDLIGAEMRAWQKMQQIAAGVFEPFGFKPIETPAIEQVDVFVHGIGQSTDVVRKEMFRVFSGANLERVFTEGTDTKLKPKQRLALRPEGTAGVVRAVVENNLVPQGSTPFKAYYAEAMFRGERPQKGRLRQFHQNGIEVFGAKDASLDAEIIQMAIRMLEANGIPYKETRSLEESMPELDILYMTRVQKERFFNEEDYVRLKNSYILTKEKMALAKPDMAVLHPLPRVNEITLDVDDDPRAAYFEQVQNAVYIRMALIMTLLGLKDPKAEKEGN